MKHSEFSTENAINASIQDLKAGLSEANILMALTYDGFSENKANLILNWAKKAIIEKTNKVWYLYQWGVTGASNNPYLAPEVNPKCLIGFRFDHKILWDQNLTLNCKRVLTSPIIKINGKEIHTKSGSLYILEDIDPDYLQWIKENNIKYDSNNPLKIKE